MEINTTYNIECLKGLKRLADNSVDCCVTSPPYYLKRDYHVKGQIGQEKTPEQFVRKMVKIFSEVRRVLKPQGTLWLNLGDSYASREKNRTLQQAERSSTIVINSNAQNLKKRNSIISGLKAKDLIGIPWLTAIALRKSGWYLRQDIIWSKPNPMPENVTDRCTNAHEYIFLLSKSNKYYYDMDSILEPCSPNTHARISQNLSDQIGSHRANGGSKTNGPMKAVSRKAKLEADDMVKNNSSYDLSVCLQVTKRNKRDVWTVPTGNFSEAHFATFPEELIVDCIKAGCPVGGLVLDPFMGAGTTALVVRKLSRNYIGFELNPEYTRIANKRLEKELGLFI